MLGVFYWYVSTLCCQIKKESTLSAPISIVEEIPCPTPSVITYKWNDINPIFKNDWNALRDSVFTGLKENQLIQITGLYRKEEKKIKDFENLGLARANEIYNKFGFEEDKARVSSKLLPLDGLSKDCLLNGIEFRYVMNTSKIKEIDERTLIYFPFNSTQKLNDKEVEEYLDILAEKVIETNERILITGHTDNSGSPSSNMELGLYRAQVIKNYLVEKGINPRFIEAKSDGEENPIASNEAKEGRAKNRRAELKILNK